MTAYEKLLLLIQEYFIDMGFNQIFAEQYFSAATFMEIVAIRLANANIMIKNKTDRKSHQTHIAITGEAIDFFYNASEFSEMDNKRVDKQSVYVIESNLKALYGRAPGIEDVKSFEFSFQR